MTSDLYLLNDNLELYEDMLYEYGQVRMYPTLKNETPDGFFKYYRFFQEGDGVIHSWNSSYGISSSGISG